MMNLLTGLAVSDISMIQTQAEIVGYKSKIEIIWKSEKLRLRSKKMMICRLFQSCYNDASVGKFLKDKKFPMYPNDPKDPIHPIHPPDFFPHCLGWFQVIYWQIIRIYINLMVFVEQCQFFNK